MAEKRNDSHPDLDRLVDLAEGLLSEAEARPLQAHLADCPRCRLELKRLGQFNSQGADSEVLVEAEWARAELSLQRGFEEKVKPAIRRGVSRPTVVSRRLWWVRVAPVAIAAMLIVALMNFDQVSFFQEDLTDDGPLRGGEAAHSLIVLDQPSEEITTAPAEFSWSSEQAHDSYILEVFSPDLESIFRLADLRQTRVVIPDSLLSFLEPGQTYLWNVQGRTGLTDAELSLTAWFRIAPGGEL